MRKAFRLILVLVLALLAWTSAVQAVPPLDLNAMAQYFPMKTPILISFRTDDDYLATLDALFQRLNAAAPEANIPPVFESLDELIDDIGRFEGGSFQSTVRSWLGDVGAFGIISLEGIFDDDSGNDAGIFMIALQVTDRAAAESFWTTGLAPDNYTTSSEGMFTLYSPSASQVGEPAFVAVGDEVVFIANTRDVLPLRGSREAKLAQMDQFRDTLTLLPESDYNITVYVNTGELFQRLLEDQPEIFDQAGMELFRTLLMNSPVQLWGATILDGRSLTIDVVQHYGQLQQAVVDMGFPPIALEPVDPAFAERIPAGMPLVIHTTNLGAIYTQMVQSLTMQSDLLDDQLGAPMADELERTLEQIRVFVRGATGLDLESELVPALTGDYALYLGLNSAIVDARGITDLLAQNPVEFGLLTEVNDPAVTQQLIRGLTETIRALPASPDAEIAISSGMIGGNNVQLITITADDLPFPIELVLGGDDAVFFFGTPAAARAALSPDGGLLVDAQFREAGAYLLDAPAAVLYMASAGLEPIANVIGITGGRSAQRDADAFRAALGLLSSSSMSASYTDDVSYLRLVWTLPG